MRLIDLASVVLHHEQTLVLARQFASRLAALLGFDAGEQTRIATAVSEIARNAFRYAAGGEVAFALERDAHRQVLVIRIVDRGPGIAALDAILSGRYRSATGLGTGIAGARRLMDEFEITSAPGGGTAVTMRKRLPAHAPAVTAERAVEIQHAMASRG